MTQEPPASEAAPELWDDTIWDCLLDSIDEGCVIPIVGPDLLHVEIGKSTTLLDQYIARRLAQTHKLAVDNLPAERALNFVVCQLVHRRGPHGIRNDIFQIMKEATFQPSKPLRQLAEITDFNLFVSMTFDSLMEKAINEARFGNNQGTSSISYSPQSVDDLPSAKDRLTQPTVYHLMGKVSTTKYYVVSDEDLLEQLCELQSLNRRPVNLFDELKKNHLLILGVDLSTDWLTRIFLRTAKGGRLSTPQDSLEILADGKTHSDHRLVSFLVHFSNHTRVFRAGGAVEFIDQLWGRWRERHAQSLPSSEAVQSRPMPGNAIFISYAREDLHAAQKLYSGLEAAGLPVWFDKSRLKPGVNYNPEIDNRISRECSCFVAVISKNTEQRLEGFFRREWRVALERDRGIHHRRKFIIPVVIDDTGDPCAVPPRFSELHYTWLPGGTVTPMFVHDLTEIVRGAQH
jgi:hypothetical protein